MTSQLEARLARLEGDGALPGTVVDPMIAAAWLHAMAIALGNFPLPWQETVPAHGSLDTVSDGLARALGYADTAAMEISAEAEPDDWAFRLDLAHTALVERYGGDVQDGFRLACHALDEIAAAKARGVAYEPRIEIGYPERGLRRALVQFGVAPDALAAMGHA